MNIRIDGMAQLQRKLRRDVLYAPPLREAMEDTLQDVQAIVESRAPRRTGRLSGSVTHKLDARPVPTWGRVAVTARRRSKKYPRGFRYPRWLEYAPKSPHQRWLRNALGPAQAVLQRRLERAKQRIEAIWSA